VRDIGGATKRARSHSVSHGVDMIARWNNIHGLDGSKDDEALDVVETLAEREYAPSKVEEVGDDSSVIMASLSASMEGNGTSLSCLAD
jgi:hypothetical protein